MDHRNVVRLTLVALALTALFLTARSCSADDDEPGVGLVPSVEQGRFGPWFLGDTHTHVAGDSGILRNNRCRPNDEADLPDVMADLAGCSERLVDASIDLATENGLDWLMATEHAPWLGSPPAQRCTDVAGAVVASWPRPAAFVSLAKTPACVRHVVTTYSHDQARASWQALHTEVRRRQEAGDGLDAAVVLGQELGTAAGISGLCASRIATVVQSTFRGPGHFGAYTVGFDVEPIDNRIFDCREDDYLTELGLLDRTGTINHPDNGDGGSDWHCWTAGDVHPSPRCL